LRFEVLEGFDIWHEDLDHFTLVIWDLRKRLDLRFAHHCHILLSQCLWFLCHLELLKYVNIRVMT